jgi:hypothetical protein
MEEWFVPIIVALLTPFFAYLGIARKLSGRIDTTEAGLLWKEAGLMREEYRLRATQCETNLRAAKNELQIAVARNTALRRENKQLREELKGS